MLCVRAYIYVGRVGELKLLQYRAAGLFGLVLLTPRLRFLFIVVFAQTHPQMIEKSLSTTETCEVHVGTEYACINQSMEVQILFFVCYTIYSLCAPESAKWKY